MTSIIFETFVDFVANNEQFKPNKIIFNSISEFQLLKLKAHWS